MSAWTSSDFSPSSLTTVAGFDVRGAATALEVSQPGCVAARLIRIGSAEWRPATMDSQVWPRHVDSEMERACNGVNLIPSLDLLAHTGKDVCIVAFEFPAGLIQELASTFGLPTGSGPRLNKTEWRLLGYDIVDIRTQTSAIYSFEWSPKEWSNLVSVFGGEFNAYGLVDREVAISQCGVFDRQIPEHAPFAPCAVWMRLPK
jgi:hypothetical protein